MSEKKSEVHIDFDSIDEDIEKVDPQPQAQPQQQPTVASPLSPEIEALLKHHHEQSINYIDHRFAKMNEQFKVHGEQIELNTSRIGKLEETVAQQNEFIKQMATGSTVKPPEFDFTQQPQESQENKGIIDSTLGTVGNVAHGIVDTAAFLCESVIDLVTLGKARRVR